MKHRLPLIALIALPLLGGPATAADEPILPSDSRIRVLLYDESDVYTITTKYGYQTNLVFSPREEILTISMGDRSLWQIIPTGNRLFIRPMDDNVTTNMTVLTSRRSYQFDLVSLAADDTDKPLYVARFEYPDDAPSVAPARMAPPPAFAPEPPIPAPAPPPAAASEPAPAKPVMNYNYTYSGSDALAPTQVFDDGRSTYIALRSAGAAPSAVLVRGKDGGERAAPFMHKDGQLVVDGVAGEIVLRHAGGDVVIYNEMINPK